LARGRGSARTAAGARAARKTVEGFMVCGVCVCVMCLSDWGEGGGCLVLLLSSRGGGGSIREVVLFAKQATPRRSGSSSEEEVGSWRGNSRQETQTGG
jgi:hypothetical protein